MIILPRSRNSKRWMIWEILVVTFVSEGSKKDVSSITLFLLSLYKNVNENTSISQSKKSLDLASLITKTLKSRLLFKLCFSSTKWSIRLKFGLGKWNKGKTLLMNEKKC